MEPAAASKFCLKSKNMLNATLHSTQYPCGDCGAPPFIDDNSDKEYDFDDTLAPTLGYRQATVDGAPHRPAPAPAASMTLVPKVPFPQPLSLQQAVKKAAQPNASRLKGKSKVTTPSTPQEPMQTQWLEQLAADAAAKAAYAVSMTIQPPPPPPPQEDNEFLTFHVIAARINWTTEFRPIYQLWETPIKQVQFKINFDGSHWIKYNHFIDQLHAGAMIYERQLMGSDAAGKWQVSMNHLTTKAMAKGLVELNPAEWYNTVDLVEELKKQRWPQINLTYQATLVYWPKKPTPPTPVTTKGKGKRGHSRVQTRTDIEQEVTSRARSAAPLEPELPTLAQLLQRREADAELSAIFAAATPPTATAPPATPQVAAKAPKVAKATQATTTATEVRLSSSGRAIKAPQRYS